LRLPFRLRGFEGRVEVFCEANHDPRGLGFGLLELPFALERVKGFPVCRAEVGYAGSGYHAVMGWIQLVSVREASGRSWTEVDLMPNHRDLETPFAAFGYLPTLFDAPGPNPPRSDETWLAESFLAACPDVARSKRVQGVAGFSWGYSLEAARPSLLEVAPLGPERWLAHLPHLEARFPSWTFLPASDHGASAPQNWSHSA
jgi:hypothetical protein